VHHELKEVADAAFEPVDPLLGDFRTPGNKTSFSDALKRGLDVLGSLALLVILSPVMVLIAILVKATSRGPVFFRQERIGQRGKRFTMLKFRSMRPDAGNAIHKDYVTWFIKSSAEAKDAAGAGVFKITNDPRITTIGRILRNTSLDEFPQFINVLRGEMSLVGPRPPLPYEVEQYKPWHLRRVLEAKPGITGLWQVTGRSRTTFDEMVRLDIRYARSVSLWTDIKILLATPKAVISGKGAC
jgi:exopolysaccharide biosynthesis polyprenyl glycosylphosphotransferase